MCPKCDVQVRIGIEIEIEIDRDEIVSIAQSLVFDIFSFLLRNKELVHSAFKNCDEDKDNKLSYEGIYLSISLILSIYIYPNPTTDYIIISFLILLTEFLNAINIPLLSLTEEQKAASVKSFSTSTPPTTPSSTPMVLTKSGSFSLTPNQPASSNSSSTNNNNNNSSTNLSGV